MQNMMAAKYPNAIAAAQPGQDLNSQLFSQFVSWIDRSANTTRAYIINLRQFIAWLRFRAITRPMREDIIAYRDWLSSAHEAIELADMGKGWIYRVDSNGNRYMVECKPSTIAQYLRIVGQFFRWTASNNLYPDIAANVHAPKVTTDHHRKDALAAADVLAIENSIAATAADRQAAAAEATKDTAGRIQRTTEQDKRLRAMYLLAVNAGLRTIEISRARVQDLETKGGHAYLYIWGKGHTEADTRKPLAAEVLEAINDYLASRSDKVTGSSPLFASTGNRSGGQPIAPTTISTMLKHAMQMAGYDSSRITAHSLRHTAGTNVQDLTGNLFLTQQHMRHADPATTEIYLHNNTEQQQADLAQQLYDRYHGKQSSNSLEQLQTIAQGLRPEQLEQLTALAKAMAK